MSSHCLASRSSFSLLAASLAFAFPVCIQSQPRPLSKLLDGKLSLDQIVQDPSKQRSATPGQIGRAEGYPPIGCRAVASTVGTKKKADDDAKPDPPALLNFSSINLATAAGAKVKRILVHEWSQRGWGNYPSWPDVVKEIQTVWAGQIDSAYPMSISMFPWSESTSWNVSVSVEFDNSTERGCLMTDGLHVSLRDVNGEIWLARLLPAH
jgi:hypothetical protein